MIVGIGCDVVEHIITQSLGWLSNSKKLLRLFTPEEILLFQTDHTLKFLSGRFAAKEAVLKCLGTGMKDGIALTDVQILRDQQGKPFIQISGETKRIAQDSGVLFWHISISHTNNSSTAFVIAEK